MTPHGFTGALDELANSDIIKLDAFISSSEISDTLIGWAKQNQGREQANQHEGGPDIIVNININ